MTINARDSGLFTTFKFKTHKKKDNQRKKKEITAINARDSGLLNVNSSPPSTHL